MQRLWVGASHGARDELGQLREEADQARAAALDTARRAARARAVADAAVREIPEKHRPATAGEEPET